MPATIFSGSDVKTLKDNLSLNDKAKILPSSGSPAGGAGLAAPVGSLALDYTNGKTYKKIGALDTDWSELGSGIGGINYVTNTDAEAGTTGWSTYADAAGAQPVDGTGGSPNVTWTRSTTTPLRGTADFNFAKDAVNRQGQGVATDITINLADQAKVLTVSFDYEILSGTYATGDLTVYLIQDPAGTPVVIQPAGYQVQSATAGTKMRQIATFQTAATGQSYRICFHVASTSASAYTLAIDNVICGPQVVQYGAPVTDWAAYTPTGSWVTNTTYAGYWRRVGDSIEVRARVSTSGAPTAASLTVSIPSGLSIDTTKAINTTATLGSLGIATINDSGLSTYTGVVQYQSTTSVSVLVNNAAGTYTVEADVTATVPFSFGANDKVDIFFSVPISGWSSTVQMSNDTDTRIVDLQVNNATSITPSGTIGTNFATAGTVNFNKTPTKDSHGGYSAGVYTVSVPGDYFVSSRLEMSHTSATGSFVGMSISVNGVERAAQAVKPANTNAYPFVSSLITGLVAGDQITIRLYSDSSTKAFVASVLHDFTAHRLSGPSAIAASESITARYTNVAGTTITNTLTTVPFATKIYDSHGSFNGSVYTISSPGKFRISAILNTVSVTLATTNDFQVQIFKGATAIANAFVIGNGAANSQNCQVCTTIDGIAGDTIEVKARISVSANLVTTANYNSFCIEKVGN